MWDREFYSMDPTWVLVGREHGSTTAHDRVCFQHTLNLWVSDDLDGVMMAAQQCKSKESHKVIVRLGTMYQEWKECPTNKTAFYEWRGTVGR
jgi:hypothetical protein